MATDYETANSLNRFPGAFLKAFDRPTSRPYYGGEVTVGSLVLTSDGISNIPTAPLALLNNQQKVAFYSGKGAPNFTPLGGVVSVYFRNDAPNVSTVIYVSIGTNAWTALAAP